VIHSALHDMGRNTTASSFVAFERSIEADPTSPWNKSKLSVWTQMLNGLTEETPSNVEGFKGVRTPLHQPHYHR
jgi:hypothetical protein